MTSDHEHILALANAGSVDFALAEYLRRGLDRVTGHEDVMALQGRLLKDLFRASSGGAARDLAQRSAAAYEAAFKSTDGFYSGINAATMSLLAGYDPDMVRMRAERILSRLPTPEDADAQAKYFITATRAEAQLLLGQGAEAAASIEIARAHDPLNFTAHASSLKQFQLIAAHRDETYDWLDALRPPLCLHYSGHLFGQGAEISVAETDRLEADILELLQRHDMGFGYGALAAGSDILIAETILREGGELHVVLPVSVARFLDVSVVPYGADWVRRFHHCLDQAHSVTIARPDAAWPDPVVDARATMASMGAAIRRADNLFTQAAQLLIWDGEDRGLGTSLNAKIWAGTGRAQFTLPLHTPRPEIATTAAVTLSPKFHAVTDQGAQADFDDFLAAVDWADAQRIGGDKDLRIGIIASLIDDAQAAGVAEDLAALHAGGTYMTGLCADWVSLHHAARFAATDLHRDRLFALRKTSI